MSYRESEELELELLGLKSDEFTDTASGSPTKHAANGLIDYRNTPANEFDVVAELDKLCNPLLGPARQEIRFEDLPITDQVDFELDLGQEVDHGQEISKIASGVASEFQPLISDEVDQMPVVASVERPKSQCEKSIEVMKGMATLARTAIGEIVPDEAHVGEFDTNWNKAKGGARSPEVTQKCVTDFYSKYFTACNAGDYDLAKHYLMQMSTC